MKALKHATTAADADEPASSLQTGGADSESDHSPKELSILELTVVLYDDYLYAKRAWDLERDAMIN